MSVRSIRCSFWRSVAWRITANIICSVVSDVARSVRPCLNNPFKICIVHSWYNHIKTGFKGPWKKALRDNNRNHPNIKPTVRISQREISILRYQCLDLKHGSVFGERVLMWSKGFNLHMDAILLLRLVEPVCNLFNALLFHNTLLVFEGRLEHGLHDKREIYYISHETSDVLRPVRSSLCLAGG